MSIPAGLNWLCSCLPRRKRGYNLRVTNPHTLARLYETRRKAAKLLRSEFDSLADFAARIGQSASYTSRMLQTGKNRKNIGEDLARRIETACGKPTGWLDRDADSLATARGTKETIWPFNFPRSEWEELPHSERREAEEQFRIFLSIAREKKRTQKRRTG